MSAADRVLEPLRSAEPYARALSTYTSSNELAEALREVRDAVELTLRLLLRESPRAPDAARLGALSRDFTVEDVVTALRRAHLVSLELAGELHALRAAVPRAEAGEPRAADGDVAAAAVRRLRTEVLAALPEHGGSEVPEKGARSAGGSGGAGGGGGGAAGNAVAGDGVAAARPRTGPADGGLPSGAANGEDAPRSRASAGSWLRWVAAAVVLVAAVLFAVWLDRGAGDPMREGIAAFRQDSMGLAEASFRAVVEADPENETAWLYVGRITRVQGRHADAADALERAALLAPLDPAVQRELGYLFMDLADPVRAAERFDRARELEPGGAANWIGFIRALRAAGDSRAEVWLERAPAEVKAALGGTTATRNP